MEHLELTVDGRRFPAFAAGDVGAPLVLCLHGFPDHARSFRWQLPALAAAGYRAIAPTMRGYAPDAQPADGDYSIARIADDVLGWLDALGAARAHLVGHDWGAVAGYAVAARAPERLRALATLAVPPTRRMLRGLLRHPGQLRKSWYMMFFQLRGLSDRALAANDYAFVERLWRDWSPGFSCPPDEMAALKATFRAPGVARAALGYYRAMFSPVGASARETRALLLGRIDVPTLAMTGADDGCMDTRLYDVVCEPRDFPRGIDVVRIASAGHFLHQERPDEVNRVLLDFLARHP